MGALSSMARADDAADRHIHGEGTPERAWRAWDGLAALAPLSIATLAPAGSRVVVVAPHPDDEVLGCGGTLAMLARAGRRVLVLGVTDGEASHAGSLRWTPGLLARRRREEREAGLGRLGMTGAPLALGLPDGALRANEDALVASLCDLLHPGDVLLATWRHDGHPDHEAAGRAAARAAVERGLRCWEMPVWMWHWARPADARVPWHRLHRIDLDADAITRKRAAVAAHASQLEPVPQEQRAAVLPDWALARVLRSHEVFFESETPA